MMKMMIHWAIRVLISRTRNWVRLWTILLTNLVHLVAALDLVHCYLLHFDLACVTCAVPFCLPGSEFWLLRFQIIGRKSHLGCSHRISWSSSSPWRWEILKLCISACRFMRDQSIHMKSIPGAGWHDLTWWSCKAAPWRRSRRDQYEKSVLHFVFI